MYSVDRGKHMGSAFQDRNRTLSGYQMGAAIHIPPLVRVSARQSATRTASSSVESGKSRMLRCKEGKSALTMAFSTLGSPLQGASVS